MIDEDEEEISPEKSFIAPYPKWESKSNEVLSFIPAMIAAESAASSGHKEPKRSTNSDEMELSDSNEPEKRNWQGIGIAVFVIFVILSLITTAIILVTPDKYNPDANKTLLTIDELVFPSVNLENEGATWLPGSILTFKDENKTIWRFDLDKNNAEIQRKVLLRNEILANGKESDAWYPSPSGDFIALEYVSKKISKKISLKTIKILSSQTSSYAIAANLENVLIFKWCTNAKTDCFIYVDSSNNLRFQNNPTELESKRVIFSGSTSFLNEDNLLSPDRTFWISSSSKKLAFISFNESVNRNSSNEIYAKVQALSHRQTLPSINLFVWFRDSGRIIKLLPPKEVEILREYYLLHAVWLNITSNFNENVEYLLCVWSNRVQNTSYFSTCTISSAPPETIRCTLDYVHGYHNMWLDADDLRIKFVAGDRFYTILPEKSTDGYYYKHVAAIPTKYQSYPQFLTQGPFDVTSIVGYDEQEKTIYFIAAKPSPNQRHLYSVASLQNDPICLSCSFEYKNCTCFDAKFSENGKFYILYCLGPGVPKTYLRSVFDSKTIMIIENNTAYGAYIGQKVLPMVRFEAFDTSKGFKSYAKMFIPPKLPESPVDEIFPMIIKINSAPGVQLVNDFWNDLSFDTYLSTVRRFIIIYVDGRGSGFKGSKYTSPIYRNLGNYEIRDQISTVSILKNTILKNTTWFIDGERLAIFGQGYGGFASGHLIKLDGFKTFKCAVLISPVTNLNSYNNTFVERFMALNDVNDNYEGYQKSNLFLNDLSSFASGKLLLIVENEMDNELIKALVEQNIQFQFMNYAYQHHSQSSAQIKHMLTMMDNFFVECFTKKANSKFVEDSSHL